MFVLTGYEKIRNVHTLGKHTGDLYIKSICGSLNDTVNIEDCWKYDDASTDKSSNWNLSNSDSSVTHDSTNNCYNISRSADGDTMIFLSDAVIPDGVKIIYDIKLTGASNKNYQPRYGLANGNFVIAGRFLWTPNNKKIGVFTTTDWTSGAWNDSYTMVTINQSLNTWYTVELTCNNGSITMTAYNGSTQIGTVSASVSGLSSTSNKLILDTAYNSGANISIKNLKVKSL